jgi:hypothetical protein
MNIDTRLKILEAKSRPMEGASWDDYDLSRLTEDERAAWDKAQAICNDDAFPRDDGNNIKAWSAKLTEEQKQALHTLNELMCDLEEMAR